MQYVICYYNDTRLLFEMDALSETKIWVNMLRFKLDGRSNAH